MSRGKERQASLGGLERRGRKIIVIEDTSQQELQKNPQTCGKLDLYRREKDKRKRADEESPPKEHNKKKQYSLSKEALRGLKVCSGKGEAVAQTDTAHYKMKALAEDLQKFCKDNSNVHRKIKKIAATMGRLASDCFQSYKRSEDSSITDLSQTVGRMKKEYERKSWRC